MNEEWEILGSTSWQPDYSAQHRGASSGYSDPAKHRQELTGAYHKNAGHEDGSRRNAFSQVPGGGQAASVPADGGVPATDKPFNPTLDGHKFSVVSLHPNGLFARNVAATSDHSLHANLEHDMSRDHKIGATGIMGSSSGQAEQDTQMAMRELVQSTLLSEDLPRDGAVNEVVVSAAAGQPGAHWFRGSPMQGEWTVPHLAGIGVGVLALSTLMAR